MTLLEASPPTEASLEAGGHAKGVAVAIVRENRDDSGLGRVKVSYPWHSRADESYWARVAVLMAGNHRGAYFIPEVGDEVLVAFERGDLRFPYIVGCLWNGKDPSPQTNADGNNDLRQIRSRKDHKLTFDDGARGRVQLELSDGKKLAIDDDGISLDDGAGNRVTIDSRSGTVSIQASARLELKAPQISLSARMLLDLDGGVAASLHAGQVDIN